MRHPYCIALALALASVCGPALAQDQPNKPVAPGQPAAERAITAELNAEVAARNAAAAEAEAEARLAYEAALRRRTEAEAEHEAALAARAANIAEAEEAQQRRMQMWRARVAACDAGDRSACAVPVGPERLDDRDEDDLND